MYKKDILLHHKYYIFKTLIPRWGRYGFNNFTKCTWCIKKSSALLNYACPCLCAVCVADNGVYTGPYWEESEWISGTNPNKQYQRNTTSQSTEKHDRASWQREKGGHDEGLMDAVRKNRELHWKRSVAFSAGFCHTDLERKWSSNVGSRASQELHLLLGKAVRMHCFLYKTQRKCDQRKHDEGCVMPKQNGKHTTRGKGCKMVWKPQIVWICSYRFGF